MKIQNILNVWVLKLKKNKEHYRSCTGFPKCIRIQQVHVSSLHLKYALQNKFINLRPMPLSSYIPESKTFTKILSSYQIITRFGSDKILSPSVNH